MMNLKLLSSCLILTVVSPLLAQNSLTVDLAWLDTPLSFGFGETKSELPTFSNAIHLEENDFLPASLEKIALPKGYTARDVQIRVLESIEQPFKGKVTRKMLDEIPSLEWYVKDERGTPYLIVQFLPYQKEDLSLVKKFEITYLNKPVTARSKNITYAQNSVMSTGEWYKIGVSEDGVHKLTKTDLQNLGINIETLNPRSVNLFGNSFGQLPYDNSVERPDDLLINSIFISGEQDESFDDEDYILFFARDANKWTYNEEDAYFQHNKHHYTDTSYYFLGINTGLAPKRIQNVASSGNPPNSIITTFDDYAYHEIDRENVLKSGRTWYGEKFDVQTTYNFTGERFTFPNIVEEDSVELRATLMARSQGASSSFEYRVNNTPDSVVINSVGSSAASSFGNTEEVFLKSLALSPDINVQFTYEKRIASAIGWLDWFTLKVRRDLRMARNQMIFRDARSVGAGQFGRFEVSNAASIEEIWEVTEAENVKRIDFERQGSVATFTADVSELREFIAFTGNEFLKPSLLSKIENQNLHSIGLEGRIDMVIVSPEFLVSEAEQLADIHRNNAQDPLNVEVVGLNAVYNEFSSGMRDVTAIKWLMKMIYDRAGENSVALPRYLLLFGDGSFDNINFSSSNSNLIPTYQSLNSLSPVRSFVSDDYFGLLSDDDGENNNDLMDISVGRLAVKNRSEATTVVNKIRRYLNPTNAIDNGGSENNSFGSWRNVISLVADDEDGNSHMINSRTISSQIQSFSNVYNIERFFIDAFNQIATPGGDRYPDVNELIDRRVGNGAFIMNYIGHGGETGWAQERILDVATILDWTNSFNMPIFMTATCEFTRFDDPLRTSAGEFVLLNSSGGGIALLTTTRLVYAGPNFRLNQNFYQALFNRPKDEKVIRLGDVYRECKNLSSTTSADHRNFTLIGDPALPMAIPEYNIVSNGITDTLGNPIDTLKALGVARVSGFIENTEGQIKEDFNGIIEAIVFDRVKERTTLQNDGGSAFTYPSQEDVVYRGQAEVVDGQFQFDFVLPKDVSFALDSTARISLYAFSQNVDAAGFQDNIMIGGRDENAVDDGIGPKINLFMNDENFVFGGYTDKEPILLANISDPNGINTVGTGIGHDISAVLDGDVANTIILNDFYSSDLNTFQSGKVRYPFDELSPGNHTVEIKVWDVHNNSNKSLIDFIVAENEELAIERVLNYPNPFTTSTEFFFEHNQSSEFLNVLIQIYTVTGKLVKTINTVSNTVGFRIEPIPWNGRDDFGDKLATGTYVYKVSVKNQAGDKDMKFEKLVILN